MMGATYSDDQMSNKRLNATGALTDPGSHHQDIENTFVISNNRVLHNLLNKETSSTDDSTQPTRKLTFLIRGIAETVPMSDDFSVILGRRESGQTRGIQADVDLSPYGANTKGVSRLHARLYMHDGELVVMDLNSTNGTFIRGERLIIDRIYPINNGDELLLGGLLVQVYFE